MKFMKSSVMLRFLIYSDFILIISCWDNGVLQLVSEQVGPSDQVVESCNNLILFCCSDCCLQLRISRWLEEMMLLLLLPSKLLLKL